MKEYAIEFYSEVVKYVKLVLKDMPEDKLLEYYSEEEKPIDIIFHMVATPHWWLKQSDKGFDFSAKFNSIQEVNQLLDKQIAVFKTKLNDENELIWTNDQNYNAKEKSVAWIMIRSAYHMMHHSAMLIVFRHMWGLPPLENANWGKIVDFAPGHLFS